MKNRVRSSVVALLFVSLFLTAVPATAAPPTTKSRVAENAAEWLVSQYHAGKIATSGLKADTIFALVSTTGHDDVVLALRTELERDIVPLLAEDPPPLGLIAKMTLGIAVAAGDPNDVAGHDVFEFLQSRMTQTGEHRGHFGVPADQHSWIMLALDRSEQGAPAASAEWLSLQTCAQGGWTWDVEYTVVDTIITPLPCDSRTPDVETTALATLAMSVVEGHDDVVSDNVAWLGAEQDLNTGGFGVNTKTTGVVAHVFLHTGEYEVLRRAVEFIESFATINGADTGAIAMNDQVEGALLYSTSSALLAFASLPLSELMMPTYVGKRCTPANPGVTVVVDWVRNDGTVLIGCATGDGLTGIDALRSAGFDVETRTNATGEYVCTINGYPENGCTDTAEPSRWLYSQAAQGGGWEETPEGQNADASTPRPGDVTGWNWDSSLRLYPSVEPPYKPIVRIEGTTRIETAIAVSQDRYGDDEAGAVVLTRSDNFADALAGTPLAAQLDAPVLLTGSDSLQANVLDEINRVLPSTGTVYVLGGPVAISETVAVAVADAGYTVERLAGEERIETAIQIAEALPTSPDTYFIADSRTFQPALLAGPPAAAVNGAVILTEETPHPLVRQYIPTGATMYAIGNVAATAFPDATAVTAASDPELSVTVAEQFFTDPLSVSVAREDTYADALSGGAHAAQNGVPLILTPSDSLDPTVATYLTVDSPVVAAYLYGGPVAISHQTENLLYEIVHNK